MVLGFSLGQTMLLMLACGVMLDNGVIAMLLVAYSVEPSWTISL